MKQLIVAIFVVLLVSCDLNGQRFIGELPDKSEMSIPFNMGEKALKPLVSLVDNDLQLKLAEVVNSDPKMKRLVSQKKMAIGLVVLNDTSNIRFARINGKVEMYAASLPKIAILLSAMDAVDKGELSDNEKLREDMRKMIARSDNDASTRIMDLLGYEKIESVLTDPKYRLYDEEYGGGLWVASAMPKPENVILTLYTASACCNCYTGLPFLLYVGLRTVG